jgi:hypothetical protein
MISPDIWNPSPAPKPPNVGALLDKLKAADREPKACRAWAAIPVDVRKLLVMLCTDRPETPEDPRHKGAGALSWRDLSETDRFVIGTQARALVSALGRAAESLR